MINKNNYYKKIESVDFSSLDERLTEGKDFVDDVTEQGSNWTLYDTEPEIKESIDLYFAELFKVIDKKHYQEKSSTKKTTSEKTKFKENQYYIDLYHTRMASLDYKTSVEAKKEFEDYDNSEKDHFYAVLLENESSNMMADEEVTIPFLKKEVKYLTSNGYHDSLKNEKKVVPKKKAQAKPKVQQEGQAVASLSVELKFIKRFLNLHGKRRNRNHFRLFINALQRAIRERVIRKGSKYAQYIMSIQDSLIKQYNAFKNGKQEVDVVLSDATRKKYSKLIGQEYEMLSVKLIKSYIGLQGRIIENIKADRLLNRIKKAVESGKLSKRDKYFDKVDQIQSNLKSFVKKNSKEGVLKIENQALNGLKLIVGETSVGYDNESQRGFEAPNPLDIDKITREYYSSGGKKNRRFYMSSTDLESESFNHVGLTGKWFNFLGDPEVGFRAMVAGKPKMGKSYLMIEFAGELAANHGTVLYVAKEEGKSATLKKKLKDTKASHPNMTVSDYIPDNLHEFQFVFFDSVTKLGLSPENLIALNESYPNISFIEIHQVTKQGIARGKNDFSHDPDILIHIPEKGYAIQNGRYNQGGELHFFDSYRSPAA